MIIGSDFEKIPFSVFNLDLVEPNSLITNSLICIIGLFLAYRTRKNFPIKQPFFRYWYLLFVLQGVGFLFGGLGHVLYNYTGVWGKFFPLTFGILFCTALEHAMICLLPEEKRALYFKLSKLKSVVALAALTTLMFTIDVENNLSTLLLVPSLNTTIGYVLTLGFLGWKYAQKTTKALYLLPISVLTLIPAAIVQAKKISFHPWFDRNDFSHLLIVVTLILYYYAIRGYYRYTQTTQS